MVWETVERPGYFGKHRDQKFAEYNRRYGVDNWRLVWQVGESEVGLDGAVLLYEDAYFAFLQSNPQMVDELTRLACDVYDDAPSNVESALDYSRQETDLTHLQDVSIRRCLVRLGRRFRGSELVRIRYTKSTHPIGLLLSPGQVPFHRPELIVEPQLEADWWERNSVEAFYQSNKCLQVRDRSLPP